MSQEKEVRGVIVFDYDSSLSAEHTHNKAEKFLNSSENELKGIKSESLEYMDLGPALYDPSKDIAPNRRGLFEHMRNEPKFHSDVVKELATAFQDGESVAIGSFTHHPDISWNLFEQEMLKDTRIKREDLRSKIKLIAGFPDIESGGTNSPDGKMFHVVAALEANGIEATPQAIQASTLIDDGKQNIVSAWNYGMTTKFVDEKGKVHPNTLPFLYKDELGKDKYIQINEDKSINIPNNLLETELQELEKLLGRTGLDVGMVIKPTKTADDITVFIYKAQEITDSRAARISADKEIAENRDQNLAAEGINNPYQTEREKTISLVNTAKEEAAKRAKSLKSILNPSAILSSGSEELTSSEEELRAANPPRTNIFTRGAKYIGKLFNGGEEDRHEISNFSSGHHEDGVTTVIDYISMDGGVTKERVSDSLRHPESRSMITEYTDQYLRAATSEFDYREENPVMPGVKATPDVINSTLAYMIHLGGEDKALSKLEEQSSSLSKDLENPNAIKDPKFQQKYAEFCASSHDNVAAYHGTQQQYFQKLAANDPNPGGKDYWTQCAATAGVLQELSKEHADINRGIAQSWGSQKEVVMDRDHVNAEVKHLREMLVTPRRESDAKPMVVSAAPTRRQSREIGARWH